MNARQEFAAFLKPLLPKSWRIVAAQRNLDNLDAITVLIAQSKINRLDAAPNYGRLHEFTVTVISPKTDVEQAEDQLDEAANLFLDRIESVGGGQGIAWSEVNTNRSYGDQYLCFDVTLTTTFKKDN